MRNYTDRISLFTTAALVPILSFCISYGLIGLIQNYGTEPAKLSRYSDNVIFLTFSFSFFGCLFHPTRNSYILAGASSFIAPLICYAIESFNKPSKPNNDVTSTDSTRLQPQTSLTYITNLSQIANSLVQTATLTAVLYGAYSILNKIFDRREEEKIKKEQKEEKEQNQDTPENSNSQGRV